MLFLTIKIFRQSPIIWAAKALSNRGIKQMYSKNIFERPWVCSWLATPSVALVIFVSFCVLPTEKCITTSLLISNYYIAIKKKLKVPTLFKWTLLSYF